MSDLLDEELISDNNDNNNEQEEKNTVVKIEDLKTEEEHIEPVGEAIEPLHAFEKPVKETPTQVEKVEPVAPVVQEPVKLSKKEQKKLAKQERKAAKGKKPFFPKVLAGAAIGLAFGIFAAGGFYGTGLYLLGEQNEVSASDESSVDVDELQKTVDELKKTVDLSTKTEAVNTASQAVYTDVSAVVDKVMPSMVSIVNSYEEVSYFFGHKYTEPKEASGSGIIVGENDTEFLIATNYHVIEDAVKLTVGFIDGNDATAYVKGYDSSMDFALIAVAKDSLSRETKNALFVAELGDSDSLRMGETAIAIGNALGYGQSVTTGVISALNRGSDLEQSVDDLIQTSAAINPGNSGGALLNIKGQVIGINSSKIGGSMVEGMGFAIPINEVKDVLVEFSNRDAGEAYDEESKGYLGIAGKSVSDTGLSELGYPDGVYINTVYEGSAAEKAGIYAGDIVTKAASQSIKTIEELQEYLSHYKAGDSVSITVVRRVDGNLSEVVLEVVLGGRDTIPE